MERKKIKALFAKAKGKLQDLERWSKAVKLSADEIAKTSAGSPSQSGDRFHSQAQAEMTQGLLASYREFFMELKEEEKLPTPKAIRPLCFVVIENEDGVKNEFFLVNNLVGIEGVSFVSFSSDLGKILIGKEEGEGFEARLGEKMKKGKVVSIE